MNTASRTSIEFFVEGDPKAQPRCSPTFKGGKSRVYTPKTAEGWKTRIALCSRRTRPVRPLVGPVRVDLTFYFHRPKSHYRKGKFSHLLKPTAPRMWHTQKPDRDNLEKAVLDVLTKEGYWKDDCQVCAGEVKKHWSDGDVGVFVWITEVTDE